MPVASARKGQKVKLGVRPEHFVQAVGDFRFIIIHRVYYPESSGNRQQNLLMTLYALISKIGIDEPKALGLDTSMVVVERVPLIINHPVIKDKVIKVIKDSETSQSRQ